MQINSFRYRHETRYLRENKNQFSRGFLLIILIIIAFSTTGCITLFDPEASQEFNADVVGGINHQSNSGQTFVSRRPNFNGLILWISVPQGQSAGQANLPGTNILFSLYHSPGDSQPVYSTSIPAPGAGDNIPITVSIPAQKNPPGTSYYLVLSSDSGEFQVKGRNEDAYPHGQAYINGVPGNADIAFRLNYDYDYSAFIKDISSFFHQIWLIFPIFILLILPGWLLLDVSKLRKKFDLIEQIGISIGLSLAIIPLIMLWTSVLKLRWSSTGVFFLSGMLVALFITRLVYGIVTSRKLKPNHGDLTPANQPGLLQRIFSLVSSPALLFCMILVGSLTIRLIMVRDLATPAWVDSVHHALITRLILENGSYPSTYLPYLNITPTTYHPGFHSIAAFFTWFTHLDLSHSLLILGQVLNGFIVFSVYLLAKSLTRSSIAALIAAFISGFLSPMPAYYTSWGRYTELTGLLVFPVVIALLSTWQPPLKDRSTYWTVGLSAIAAGGLFMIHYRVVVFLGCLLLAGLVILILTGQSTTRPKPSQLLLVILVVVGVSILAVLPWFIPTLKNLVVPKLAGSIESKAVAFSDFSWPYLTSALGKQAIALAGLGLLWSIIRKKSLGFLVILWVAFLFFFANLDALKLPGGGLITNISVEIILFIPISILGGYFLDQKLLSWRKLVPSRLTEVLALVTMIIFAFIAYLGARQLIPILNPVTILSRQADLPAIQWVEEHIPVDETFVINPFPWGYGLYAGNDGGYWIEPLSGRLTSPPPVLYGLAPGYKQVSQLSQQVISLSTDPLALHDYLLSQQIHYLFIGARGGVLPPEKLVSSGLYDVLYHQDGAWVLAVKP